jgi:glycosyltransferase involved in cell wall biosynthesis
LVFSKSKLIWGIRGSITDLKMYDSFSKYIFKVEKVLSSFIDLIIYNSYHSEKGHNLIGFSPKNSIVIQNGIDLNRFKSDKNKRLEFRTKYNLEQNDLAIGITSRIDPIKGYIDFCNAAVLILNKYTNIKIFSIGYGIESIIKECETILGHFNNTRFIWLGKQLYPENIMTGWDIYCSASLPGEGFPNAIAEAMACELAPVVTESGDSSIIVANIGLISKCSDSENLFENLEKMINSNELENLKISSRIRVLNNYSLIQMVEKTESQILRIVQIYKK